MQNLINRVVHVLTVFVLLSLLTSLFGCAPRISSQAEIETFMRAGPIKSEDDYNNTTGLKSHTGPYRVMKGDILEFQMPAILRVISADLPEWLRPVNGHNFTEPYLARVNQDGQITLPIIGTLLVSGKTLAQVEATVVDAYYPKYVVNRPMVVCEIKQYQYESERIFTVMGLVNVPGAFPYPSDVQYNLMEALAFAGGLDMVADPRYLKIFRQDESGEVLSITFKVDKKTQSDAFAFLIKPGDLVYVDHTFNTRLNKFMSDVFHITFGAETQYRDF